MVALKRKLAANKSPLMGNLMLFLRELMKDYKDEIQEILAEDRQLVAEIDFDLKRFEQQERLDAELQTSRVQQGDRRSRVNTVAPESSETSTTNTEISKTKTPGEAIGNNPSEDIQQISMEDQEPIVEADANQPVGQRQSKRASANGDGEVTVEQAARVVHTSHAFLQPEIPNVPILPNVAAQCLLRSRIMSTPIRNVPVDDVSFRIRHMDLSAIQLRDPNQTDSLPELEASSLRPKRRRL